MLKTRTITETSSTCRRPPRGKSYDYKRPTYITLTDFMRIQNEINPINAEYENRKAYEEKLKMLSQNKSKNWADSLEMKKKNEFELAKKRFLQDEERRRRIDEEEKKYMDTQNDIILQRAKHLLFEEQDPVKAFNSKLLYCDMLKERDYQKEITLRKKQMNEFIEKQFFEADKKRLEEMDKKEAEKKRQQELKRMERMQTVRDQLKESKIKIIQDYQERLVEGQLMKLNMQKALEDERKKNELREKQKIETQKEYFQANERIKKDKELQKLKELEEEKKIEEFAIKKQQQNDLRRKVEQQKLKDKQDNHQKMIDRQFNELLRIQKEKEDKLNKSINNSCKAKDDREERELKEQQQKRQKMINDIKEQMENNIKEKENKRNKEKQEDMEYIDDFKKKLKLLEESEKQERLHRKQKEKDLAEYHKLQTEEKKRIAMHDFVQLNEDSYKALRRLEIEDDDFIKYAEHWIQEYKKQGKNINPLLLELKKYKKDYSLK